jgi:hypothetical protein
MAARSLGTGKSYVETPPSSHLHTPLSYKILHKVVVVSLQPTEHIATVSDGTLCSSLSLSTGSIEDTVAMTRQLRAARHKPLICTICIRVELHVHFRESDGKCSI